MLLQYVFLKDLSKMPKLSYSHFVLLSLSQGEKLNFPPFSVNLVTCKSLTLRLPSETVSQGPSTVLLIPHWLLTFCWNCPVSQPQNDDTVDSIQSPQQWQHDVSWISQSTLVGITCSILLTLKFRIKFECVHPLLE